VIFHSIDLHLSKVSFVKNYRGEIRICPNVNYQNLLSLKN